MKAISIKQPWASLIVEGIKDIENRNWFTYYRGLLYIHASKGFDIQGANVLTMKYPEYRTLIEKSDQLRGGLIGKVQMIDCVKSHRSKWFQGKYGFVFQSPQKIEFHPLRGQLSIFDFCFNTEVVKKEKQMLLFED